MAPITTTTISLASAVAAPPPTPPLVVRQAPPDPSPQLIAQESAKVGDKNRKRSDSTKRGSPRTQTKVEDRPGPMEEGNDQPGKTAGAAPPRRKDQGDKLDVEV